MRQLKPLETLVYMTLSCEPIDITTAMMAALTADLLILRPTAMYLTSLARRRSAGGATE